MGEREVEESVIDEDIVIRHFIHHKRLPNEESMGLKTKYAKYPKRSMGDDEQFQEDSSDCDVRSTSSFLRNSC